MRGRSQIGKCLGMLAVEQCMPTLLGVPLGDLGLRHLTSDAVLQPTVPEGRERPEDAEGDQRERTAKPRGAPCETPAGVDERGLELAERGRARAAQPAL